MSLAAPDSRLDQALDDVTRLLEKHRVLASLTHRQEGPKRDLLDQLQQRQNLTELHARVNPLHPADFAFVLERLMPDERLLIWQQLDERPRGEVLLEVSPVLRSALIDATSDEARSSRWWRSCRSSPASVATPATRPSRSCSAALNQIQGGNTGYLVVKELIVSLLNGIMWGGLMGLFAWGIYGRPALGAVMMAAMVLNLLLAAMVGVAVPVLLDRAGRDPVQGASVLLTFATDSCGFFLFLGLARLLLI
jgi:Mg/Co/Ni transporter MgtE